MHPTLRYRRAKSESSFPLVALTRWGIFCKRLKSQPCELDWTAETESLHHHAINAIHTGVLILLLQLSYVNVRTINEH